MLMGRVSTRVKSLGPQCNVENWKDSKSTKVCCTFELCPSFFNKVVT
jgi:hypothetical protein